MKTYTIIRMYRDRSTRQTIDTGLTLEQAQEHCSDNETSSSTCTARPGTKRTEKYGPWFDGYESE